MPAAPGEKVLTTLFADVHYCLSDPSTTPQHHRFVKGSYVYIYHDPALHQGKLEIANHAGTPDQDAFSGTLNTVSVQYSYNHPTLCTFRVDACTRDQSEWHLPAYDERNQQKYLYKLHTVDIYLWTENDAATFLGHLKAVMPVSRLEIKDVPSRKQAGLSPATLAEHRDSMSPVVQQLEKTAVGAQFPPRAESTASTHSLTGSPTPTMSEGRKSASPMVSPLQPPAPMAYNPAAPAAPEPIAHREKTPPPSDGGTGTGLAAAAKHDTGPRYAGVPQDHQRSDQPTPHQAYFSGLPQQGHPSMPTFSDPPQCSSPAGTQRTYSGNLPPPPPPGGPSPHHQTQVQAQRPFSFAPSPVGQQDTPPTSPPAHQQTFNRQPSFGPNAAPTTSTTPQFATSPQYQPSHSQYANYPRSPGFASTQPPTPSAPPAYVGHTPLSSPGLPPPPQQFHPQAQLAQQGALGYSSYNYSAAQSSPSMNQNGAYMGDVHNQVYRPTDAEAAHAARAHGHASGNGRPAQPGRQASSKLEERVVQTERKVSGFLKRLDKLI